MTWESEDIGQLGSTPWAHEFALWYIPQVLGDPPDGCELVLNSHEHDLGEYSTIELRWNSRRLSGPPQDYIDQCERLLDALDHDGLVDIDVLDPDAMREYLRERE